MALVSARQLLDHAAENGYGVPAFNVNNMEQIQAIMEAAEETDSPVILQGSAGARAVRGGAVPAPPRRTRRSEAWPDHPRSSTHQDHGASPGGLRRGDPLGLHVA